MSTLIILVLIIIMLFVLNYKSLKETKLLSSDEELDKATECLPSNAEICKELQEMLGSNSKVELDDKTKSSAFIFYLNKIILSNTESSKKDFSRVLFIAHECVHSIQDKTMHIINFTLANIKNIFDIVVFVLLILKRCSLELITISLLVSFLSFYYRIILESDAVYRSVIYSRKYLEKKGLNYVADRYEEIVPKTIKSMYFSYFIPILIRHVIFIIMFILIR